VYPQRHHLSARVRVLLDFLAERFAIYRDDPAATPDASSAPRW
jgi:LysR family transcriptional regulator, transcriptional activator for dmlA